MIEVMLAQAHPERRQIGEPDISRQAPPGYEDVHQFEEADQQTVEERGAPGLELTF